MTEEVKRKLGFASLLSALTPVIVTVIALAYGIHFEASRALPIMLWTGGFGIVAICLYKEPRGERSRK